MKTKMHFRCQAFALVSFAISHKNHPKSAAWFTLILLASVLAYPAEVKAQHKLLLYHLRQVPQSNLLNPGQMPTVKGHFGFPGLSGIRIGAANSGFSYSQWDRFQGSDSNDFDFAALQRSLKPNLNRFVTDNELQLLSFGAKIGKSYLSFDVGEFFYASGNYTSTLFGMLDDIQQNRLLDTQRTTYDLSGIELNGAYYRSYSLGYTRQVSPKLTLGGRFRYLQGVAGLWTENKRLRLRYPGDGDFFKVAGQLVFLTAGLNTVADAEVSSLLFPRGNAGFAFDFGAVYQVNDQLSLSYSALNLGQISWKKNINYQVVADHLNFSSVDTEEHLNTWEEVADNLVDGEPPNEAVRFTTPLPQRFFLGGRYDLNPRTSLGVLVNAVRFNTTTDLAVALSANTRLLKVFGVSASLSYNRYQPVNLGAGFSLDLGFFQLYTYTDNLVSALDWKTAHNAQAQIGINFTFGKVTAESPKASPPIVFSDPAGSAEEPSTGNPVPDTLALTEQAVPDPQIPLEDSGLPTGLADKADTPIGDVGHSEDLSLSATTLDFASGEPLTDVKVAVYKGTDSSDQELVYIDSFPNGTLQLSMERAVPQWIEISKPGYETRKVVLEMSDSQAQPLNWSRVYLLKKAAEQEAAATLPPVAEEVVSPDTTGTADPMPVAIPDDPVPAEINTDTLFSDLADSIAIMEEPIPSAVTEKPSEETSSSTAAEEMPSVEEPVSTGATENSSEEKSTSPSEAVSYLISNDTYLQKGPVQTSKAILRLKTGDRVEVIKKTGQYWWKVRYGEATGYVPAQLLWKE